MFGIVRPCRHRLGDELRDAWMSHLCGLCLTLRDRHGQLARAATNVDGLLLSVLVSAQVPGGGQRRTAGPCGLRGMRRAEVIASSDAGARLSAAVSLTAAATRARDHIADADGPFARRSAAAVANRFADRAAEAGARTGSGVGFDVAVLERAAVEARRAEAAAGPGTPLLAVTAATEEASAAAFAHTAVVAGRPGNVGPLAEAGRRFGRIVHLLDAVADQAEDDARGAWNPLTATGCHVARARACCDDAALGLRLALADVDFTGDVNTRLAHVLLVHELGRAIQEAFRAVGPPPAPDHPDHRRRTGPPRQVTVPTCLAAAGMFLTCRMCCDYTSPIDGERKEGWCSRCGDACDCCGDGCDCCGDGCDCGGCDCNC
jgi:Family of unknown function (DUF5685)